MAVGPDSHELTRHPPFTASSGDGGKLSAAAQSLPHPPLQPSSKPPAHVQFVGACVVMCVLVIFVHNHISMWHNHISMAAMQQALPGGTFEAIDPAPPLTVSRTTSTVRALTLQNAAGRPIAGAALTATTTTTLTATARGAGVSSTSVVAEASSAGTLKQEHPRLPQQQQQLPGGVAGSHHLAQHSSLHAAFVRAAAVGPAASDAPVAADTLRPGGGGDRNIVVGLAARKAAADFLT